MIYKNVSWLRTCGIGLMLVLHPLNAKLDIAFEEEKNQKPMHAIPEQTVKEEKKSLEQQIELPEKTETTSDEKKSRFLGKKREKDKKR